MKIFGIDKDKIIARLVSLKAKKLYEGLLKVVYLDFADRRIEKAGELLRVRNFGNSRVEIVYKSGKKVDSGYKEMDEISAEVVDFESMCKIFEKLRLKKMLYYEKKRGSFQLNDAKVEIDEYPNGFVYLEVESDAPEKIEEAIETLELGTCERSTETVDEVFERMFGEGQLNGLKFLEI